MTGTEILLLVSVVGLCICCIAMNMQIRDLQNRFNSLVTYTKDGFVTTKNMCDASKELCEVTHKMCVSSHEAQKEFEKWITQLSNVVMDENKDNEEKFRAMQSELAEIKRYYVTYVSRKDKSNGR